MVYCAATGSQYQVYMKLCLLGARRYHRALHRPMAYGIWHRVFLVALVHTRKKQKAQGALNKKNDGPRRIFD
jgi:hypothetical protein